MLELTVIPFNAVDLICRYSHERHYFRVIQPDTHISGTEVLINGKVYRVIHTSKFPDVSGTQGQIVVKCKPIEEPHARN